MREIVLDTETTGLSPAEGHRIVEIGAVELRNHMPTGKTWHRYLNPERDMPAEAFAVHGLSNEFLRDKPVFADIAEAFVAFIAEARLVIHNASFDLAFINAELGAVERPAIPAARAIDTLEIARRRFPGSPASLDALCRRFGIDNSARTQHGALLDSEILAEVYLELVGGRQPDFGLLPGQGRDPSPNRLAAPQGQGTGGREAIWRPGPRPAPLPPRLSDNEAAAHAAFVDRLGDDALWKKLS